MAKTILIVDDSNTARASVEYTLKKAVMRFCLQTMALRVWRF